MLLGTSAILFNAIKPIIDTKGIIETDLFPDLKYNFFITAGFILLIALVGSIVLTLRFNNTDEGQIVNKQLSRTDNFLSFFK